MAAHPQRTLLLAALALYLLVVAASVASLELKRESLSFHTRDYPYFIEQAAKLSDPKLTDRFATNIDGFNFLGLQGPEGIKNLYQAIHTEYFRYAYAPLYYLFQTPLAIYIFYCLVFYLPLLYAAFLMSRSSSGKWAPWLLLAGLFLLFPGLFDTVTFDLRGRIQLISAWSLVTLAVFYRRPFLEKLIFFIFLLLTREEGILLGLFVLAMDFARNRQWKTTLVFVGLDAAALAAFFAFMQWGGYDRVEDMFDPLNFAAHFISDPWMLAAAAAALLAVAACGVWVWRKRRTDFPLLAQLLIYLGATGLTAASVYRYVSGWVLEASQQGALSAWDIFLKALIDPSNTLVYFMILLLLVLAWEASQGKARRVLTGTMLGLCAFFAVLSLQIIPARVSAMQPQAAPAQLVWNFKAQMDRYHDQVLVDFNTYQAFYNCENIYVYNRLPLWMVDPKDRYYPQNKEFLARLIHDRMEYAVISKESQANVQELVVKAGLQASVLGSNDEYLILKLR